MDDTYTTVSADNVRVGDWVTLGDNEDIVTAIGAPADGRRTVQIVTSDDSIYMLERSTEVRVSRS